MCAESADRVSLPVGGAIELTFDDGPSRHTPPLLRVLERHRCSASFFMRGCEVERHPEIAQAVHRAGHEIGNHSYSHPNLTDLDEEAIRRELTRCNEAIVRVGLPEPRIFRPPYAEHDARVRRVAESLGLSLQLWDVDPRDWERPPSHEIVRRVCDAWRPGAVILLHDGGGERGSTISAVETLLAMSKKD
jgi:peptidoglycan-N-acetylglucosamine deacetylase